MLKWIIAALFGGGAPQEEYRVKPPPGPGERERDPDGFRIYDTFPLRDGHLLASELERLGIPFEVDLDDGIDDVDWRFGSNGDKATLSIFLAEQDFEILDDLVKLHFHVGN